MLSLGDCHGKFNELIDCLVKHDINNVNILQVGDFGIGFNFDDMDKLLKLNNYLIDKNIQLLLLVNYVD